MMRGSRMTAMPLSFRVRMSRPKGNEEGQALGLGPDAGVEDDGDAYVLPRADDPADALAEFEDGFGDAVFHEAVAAAVFDVFDAGGG